MRPVFGSECRHVIAPSARRTCAGARPSGENRCLREQTAKPSRSTVSSPGPGRAATSGADLVEMAEAWPRPGDRAKFDAALGELAVTEAFHAYPGPQLLAALRDNKSDARAIAALARRILRTLLTGGYRQNAGEWDEQEDDERRDGRRAAADARSRGGAPALFRGPDRHRRAARRAGPRSPPNGAGCAARRTRSSTSRSSSAASRTRSAPPCSIPTSRP